MIENGTFAWEPETVVLRDINLNIKPGSLVAVVGSVGSGTHDLDLKSLFKFTHLT